METEPGSALVVLAHLCLSKRNRPGLCGYVASSQQQGMWSFQLSFRDRAQGLAVPGGLTQGRWHSLGLAWTPTCSGLCIPGTSKSELVLGQPVRKAGLPSPGSFALHFPSCWGNLLPLIQRVIFSCVSLFLSNQCLFSEKAVEIYSYQGVNN